MTRWKNILWISLAAIALATVASFLVPSAIAQVRAALVRDVDAPTLQPFHAGIEYDLCCINDQRLVTTVPAGKRLVIEHFSWRTVTDVGQQFVFAGLRVGTFGPFRESVQINPPHASVISSARLQDGSQPTRVYFDAGEEVWVSASVSGGTDKSFRIDVHGYFVNNP